MIPADDPSPFGFGFLEIDQKADASPGGSQVVETLRQVFVGQAFHAFQFDNEHVFDEYVAVVFSNILAFIADGKRCLCGSPDAPQAEFPKQGALVYLFEESRTKILETSRMALITRSVSESGHRRSSVFIGG